MADLIENDVQMKALNSEAQNELLYPITKAKLVKDLNFFGKIKIGNNGLTAVGIDSVLEIAANAGIIITVDNTSKKITFEIDSSYFLTKDSVSSIIKDDIKIFNNYKFDNSIDLKYVLSKE